MYLHVYINIYVLRIIYKYIYEFNNSLTKIYSNFPGCIYANFTNETPIDMQIRLDESSLLTHA